MTLSNTRARAAIPSGERMRPHRVVFAMLTASAARPMIHRRGRRWHRIDVLMGVVFRNMLALVVGLAVGLAVNALLIELNSAIYPLPDGLDPATNVEGFQRYIDSLPALAFVIIMAAHLGQATVGGWIAARLSATRPRIMALVIGALSLAGGVMMMAQVRGPIWMYAELPLYLLLSWSVGAMEHRRRERP